MRIASIGQYAPFMWYVVVIDVVRYVYIHLIRVRFGRNETDFCGHWTYSIENDYAVRIMPALSVISSALVAKSHFVDSATINI